MSTTSEIEAAERVQQLLGQLSLAEKIWIMHGELPFKEGLAQMLEQDSYHKHPVAAGSLPDRGIDGIRFIDGPRGVVLEGGATTFPVPMARGASFDTDLERRIGIAIGREHRALGGNLFGGVCINLLRHPGWGRAQETYGEDPYLLGEMGAALTEGVQQQVMACVKHFALNSMENARFKVDVSASKRTLHEMYLPHFKRVVDAGAAAVMSAYNAVNGEWCGHHRWLLRDILKQRWGFKGFVVTDFVFGMRNARSAALGGQDLEMPFQMHYARFLKQLVESGEVPQQVVDEAVTRILSQQLKYRDLPIPPRSVLSCDAHTALAREAARKSFVLLKNGTDTDAPLLPLAKTQSLAVIGALANRPNLGDRGSSDGRPDYVITPLAGIKAAAAGAPIDYCDGSDLQQAAACAAAADTAIVVVGYTHEDEGEYIAPVAMEPFADGIKPPGLLDGLFRLPLLAPLWRRLVARAAQKRRLQASPENELFGRGGDRRSLQLPAAQRDLIKTVAAANPRTAVLVMSGSAVLMEDWRRDAAAIMLIWYPGMEGGNALGEVLFGEHAPSGRLPFVIPTDAAHLPAFDPDAEAASYDLWHGYRLLARNGHQPAFAFGYGLSYSDIAYENLHVAQQGSGSDACFELVVRLRNTGAVAVSEVLQIYISAIDAAVERAALELKAFARVPLAAGEARSVALKLPVSALAYFDEPADTFMVASGRYAIIAARHAGAEDALSATVEITAAEAV